MTLSGEAAAFLFTALRFGDISGNDTICQKDIATRTYASSLTRLFCDGILATDEALYATLAFPSFLS